MDNQDNRKKTRGIVYLFKQDEFKIFLFCLSLFIFFLPYLTGVESRPPQFAFYYLFISWAGLIICLLIMSLGRD